MPTGTVRRIVQGLPGWQTVEFPGLYFAVLRQQPGLTPSRLQLVEALQESCVQVHGLRRSGADTAAELRAWRRELEAAPARTRASLANIWQSMPGHHEQKSSAALEPLVRLAQRYRTAAEEARPALDPRLAALLDALDDHLALRAMQGLPGPGDPASASDGEVPATPSDSVVHTGENAAGVLASVLTDLEREAIAHYGVELAAVAEHAERQIERAARLADPTAQRRFEELHALVVEAARALR